MAKQAAEDAYDRLTAIMEGMREDMHEIRTDVRVIKGETADMKAVVKGNGGKSVAERMAVLESASRLHDRVLWAVVPSLIGAIVMVAWFLIQRAIERK